MWCYWYAFTSEVDWSTCLVSWCADRCRLLEIGVIPKFAQCQHGEIWFKDREQWEDGDYIPSQDMLIFLDNAGGKQDGIPDSVGIVKNVTDDTVYAVFGDIDGTCQTVEYFVGQAEVYGYGVPLY